MYTKMMAFIVAFGTSFVTHFSPNSISNCTIDIPITNVV